MKLVRVALVAVHVELDGLNVRLVALSLKGNVAVLVVRVGGNDGGAHLSGGFFWRNASPWTGLWQFEGCWGFIMAANTNEKFP